MDNALRLHLAHMATARAHLLGSGADPSPATRRRYWRELAAAATLAGRPWPDAELLGAEPTAPPAATYDARVAGLRALLDAHPDASPGDLLANLPATYATT